MDINFIALLCAALFLVGLIVGLLGDIKIDSKEASYNMRRDPEEPIVLGRSLFTSPIKIYFSNAHWFNSAIHKRWSTGNHYCTHSPQVWPWWRLLSFNLVRLDTCAPSVGWRLWVYTRWGAVYMDVSFDRRIKK